MREISLTRGLVALVDDADYDVVVAAGKWHANPHRNTFYARRNIHLCDRRTTSVQMHNLVTGWSFVDHVNGDGLDNRRANLRPADHSKNAMNRAMAANNTSGFKGVSRRGSKWVAYVKVKGRQTHLGYFDTPQQAALAYDAAALESFGEFARPNFPKKVTSRG